MYLPTRSMLKRDTCRVSSGSRDWLCWVPSRRGTPFGAPREFSQGFSQWQAGCFRYKEELDHACLGRLRVVHALWPDRLRWGPPAGPVPGFRTLVFTNRCLNFLMRNSSRL